jgi:hypothetical protein
MYGFLRGEFQPASSDRLHVSVCVASSRGKVFANNLACAVDEAQVGLPAEYSDAVFDGIALAKGELTRVAAGRLLINRAAHVAVGSCNAVFKHLATALIKLLNWV